MNIFCINIYFQSFCRTVRFGMRLFRDEVLLSFSGLIYGYFFLILLEYFLYIKAKL